MELQGVRICWFCPDASPAISMDLEETLVMVFVYPI